MSTIKKKVPEYKKAFKKLSGELLEFFETGNHKSETIDLYVLRRNKIRIQDIWHEHKSQILEKWIIKYPGFRPFAWWEFEAPRQAEGKFPRVWFDGQLVEPRKRLGGKGSPPWEVGNSVKPIFYKGIPSDWSCVINGKIILRNFDKTDPPTFQRECVYLQKHGLLTPTEEKIIAENPELLNPVSILEVFDFD